jgi:hypothetical protein
MPTNPPPNTELPADPAAFYAAGPDLPHLAPPSLAELPSALERLGPSPFPRTGFPFLGFLATLYDQVATTSRPSQREGSAGE